jgi:hypothetical protein
LELELIESRNLSSVVSDHKIDLLPHFSHLPEQKTTARAL